MKTYNIEDQNNLPSVACSSYTTCTKCIFSVCCLSLGAPCGTCSSLHSHAKRTADKIFWSSANLTWRLSMLAGYFCMWRYLKKLVYIQTINMSFANDYNMCIRFLKQRQCTSVHIRLCLMFWVQLCVEMTGGCI
jgi:hypothetical protein